MRPSVAVVLVEPQGDLNIGAAARALSNFGLGDLRLVKPADHLTSAAFKMACHAKPIVEGARIFPDLASAVGDRQLTIGFSRRGGKYRKALLPFKKALAEIRGVKKVALVFGREDDGLNNDDLHYCDLAAYIPTSSKYPSLNMAQAVGLACYELYNMRKRRNAEGAVPAWVHRREIDRLLTRMDEGLVALGYDDRDNGRLRRSILKNIAGVFSRSRLLKKELNMWQGIVASIMAMRGKGYGTE